MLRCPPISTSNDTLLPYTTLFLSFRFATLDLSARRARGRRGVRLGEGVAEVPVEGRRVRIEAHDRVELGEAAHEARGDLDEARAGEHGNAGAARTVRSPPLGTRAAHLDRSALSVPRIHEQRAREIGTDPSWAQERVAV